MGPSCSEDGGSIYGGGTWLAGLVSAIWVMVGHYLRPKEAAAMMVAGWSFGLLV